jgi:hypothetical protein
MFKNGNNGNALIKKSSGSKSQKLLLHFGEVVGFDKVLDELFRFRLSETKMGNLVDPVLLVDGVGDFAFLDETANLVHLFFRGDSDCGAHITAVLLFTA